MSEELLEALSLVVMWLWFLWFVAMVSISICLLYFDPRDNPAYWEDEFDDVG